MHEEIKIVKLKGKRIYVRSNGELLTDQHFDFALQFINGYAIVGIGNKYGILNSNGTYLFEPQFDFAELCNNETEFMKGIARVQISGIEYGIGLQKLKEISPEFSQEEINETINKINSESKQISNLAELTHTNTSISQAVIMKQPNLSQSLNKEVIDITKGKACAFALHLKYYLKRDFSIAETDTKVDARKLGIWFEYTATGAKPVSGIIPQPQLLKSGTNKGEKKAPYKIMEAHVENWKALALEYKFEPLKINQYYKIDVPDIGGASLRMDWLGKVWNKDTDAMEVSCIDIKSSGKGDNKWDADGWERSRLREKSRIMIQPLHTKWLWWELHKRDIPFYFAWFDSSDASNFRFIRVEIPHNNIEVYPELLQQFRMQLNHWEENGFPPTKLPEICGDCPISASCEHRVKVPQVEVVPFDISKSDFMKNN